MHEVPAYPALCISQRKTVPEPADPVARWPRFAADRVHAHHDAADAAALLERHGFDILSRRAFYDPPFEARKNVANVLNGVCEVAGRAFGIVDVAPYSLFLTQRRDQGLLT